MQCSRCRALASGMAAGRRLATVNLPATRGTGRLRHADCGGALEALDTADALRRKRTP